MVDRDDDDCLALKQKLEDMSTEAGFITKTVSGHDQRFQVANRIAIEELEACFFGDWPAVQAAYPRVSTTSPLLQSRLHFRRYVGSLQAGIKKSLLF